MADASVADVMRIPGRLYAEPSDINADPPFGTGTALGLVRDAEFRLHVRTGIVTAEEWGSVAVEAVYAGESAVLACVLREWDDDAIGDIFPNISTSSFSTADKSILGRVSGAGVNRAGHLLSSQSIVLFFAPLAIDRHPCIIGRKAVPMVEESAMLSMSLAEEFGIGVVWNAIPDSSGRTYDIGKREDLTL